MHVLTLGIPLVIRTIREYNRMKAEEEERWLKEHKEKRHRGNLGTG